jgi:quercetin dioxygenase-like cupin family protein
MTDTREFMTGWFEPAKQHMTAWSNREKEGLRGTATGKRYVPGFRPFDMLTEPNQSTVIFENSDQRIGVEYVTGTRPNFVRYIDFDALFFQFSGRSVIETEFGVYEVKPGELLHIPAGIAHRSSGTADCARLFAYLNEPLTHIHSPDAHESHVEYEVIRRGGPDWAGRAVEIAPPKGEVIEKMICWRDTPEYYTTVRRNYDVLVGASSLQRDVAKSGITKIRAFDFFTEITGRRGPGPKLAESRYFVAEVYNTNGEQFAFHRALRSEEFGFQFRGNAVNMSEFEHNLKMTPGDLALIPLGIAHSVICEENFLRIVLYSKLPWDVKIDPTNHAYASSFEVKTNVIEAPKFWANAAE